MNWLACPRVLPLALALFVLSPLSVALADPSIDAATKASQVNQEQCANVHNISKQQVSALGMQKVVEVWAEVGRVYEQEGKAPYLLFWRGVLAQCLDRRELAVLDLESFVASQKGQSMFADLVRQSKTRLKRLGGRAKAGQGPSAIWLRKADPFEVDFSYGVATGIRGLGCTDSGGKMVEPGDEGQNRPSNAACVDGAGFRFPSGDTRLAPMEDVAPPFWPVGLRLGLSGFPLHFLGVGAVVMLDESLQSEALEPHAPGPVTQLFVGPQLRFLSSVASGRRAGEFRIAPRFAVAWGRSSPWAGYKNIKDFGFLDAGAISTRHLGFQIEVSGRMELSGRAVLSVSGEFAYFRPAGSDAVETVIDPSSLAKDWVYETNGVENSITVVESIEIFPPMTQVDRLYAGGRAALLFPHPKVNIAMGPFFELGFHSLHIIYPNSLEDEWDVRETELKRISRVGKPVRELLEVWAVPKPDPHTRKVYSTRRQDLLFRLGVEVHFGAGLLGKRK